MGPYSTAAERARSGGTVRSSHQMINFRDLIGYSAGFRQRRLPQVEDVQGAGARDINLGCACSSRRRRPVAVLRLSDGSWPVVSNYVTLVLSSAVNVQVERG